MRFRSSSGAATLAKAAIVFVAYYVGTQLGLTHDLQEVGVVTALWPASAVGVAALVLLGLRMWPAIALADLLGSLTIGIPLAPALALAAASTVEPVAGALLLNRLGMHPRLDRLKDVLYLLVAAVTAPAMSATLGVPILIGSGLVEAGDALPGWGLWWAADALSIAVLAPFIFVWSRPPLVPSRPLGRIEAIALALTTLLVAVVVFRAPIEFAYWMWLQAFLVFPFLVWAAVRFRQHGATAIVLLVVLIASWGTADGLGPFGGIPPGRALLVFQIFAVVHAIPVLVLALVVGERDRSRLALEHHRDRLEEVVQARTRALERANEELEAFSYRVSHDLRAPLRRIASLSRMTVEDHAGKLGEEGRADLERVEREAAQMRELVDDLLRLSSVSRVEMHDELVDLSAIARDVADALRARQPERDVEFVVHDGVEAVGDAHLLRVALQNLLENAWKYTGRCEHARIEFGASPQGGETLFYVRDNGVGFPPEDAAKLFRPFSRLDTARGFEGTGVGLATVARIVERHGGRVRAEGAPGEGATFSFTIPPRHQGPGGAVPSSAPGGGDVGDGPRNGGRRGPSRSPA